MVGVINGYAKRTLRILPHLHLRGLLSSVGCCLLVDASSSPVPMHPQPVCFADAFVGGVSWRCAVEYGVPSPCTPSGTLLQLITPLRREKVRGQAEQTVQCAPLPLIMDVSPVGAGQGDYGVCRRLTTLQSGREGLLWGCGVLGSWVGALCSPGVPQAACGDWFGTRPLDRAVTASALVGLLRVNTQDMS